MLIDIVHFLHNIVHGNPPNWTLSILYAVRIFSTLTKKMVVMALLTRLKLPGDHFNKEQRNTVAATAKQVLVSC